MCNLFAIFVYLHCVSKQKLQIMHLTRVENLDAIRVSLFWHTRYNEITLVTVPCQWSCPGQKTTAWRWHISAHW